MAKYNLSYRQLILSEPCRFRGADTVYNALVAAFEKLLRLGAEELCATFLGYGGRGQPEDVTARDRHGKRVRLSNGFCFHLAEIFCPLLPKGWAYGDGSFVDIRLDLIDRTINRKVRWRLSYREDLDEDFTL